MCDESLDRYFDVETFLLLLLLDGDVISSLDAHNISAGN
jgi:hypothetical protein